MFISSTWVIVDERNHQKTGLNHFKLSIMRRLNQNSLITYLVLHHSQLLLRYGPTRFRGLLTKSVYSACLKATSLLPLKSRNMVKTPAHPISSSLAPRDGLPQAASSRAGPARTANDYMSYRMSYRPHNTRSTPPRRRPPGRARQGGRPRPACSRARLRRSSHGPRRPPRRKSPRPRPGRRSGAAAARTCAAGT